MTIFEIIAFIMALYFMVVGIYFLRKAIDELSRRCYRNCEFTINPDQLQEIFDYIKILEEERNER